MLVLSPSFSAYNLLARAGSVTGRVVNTRQSFNTTSSTPTGCRRSRAEPTPRVYIPESRWVTVLHLDRDVRLDPGHCWEDMVQHLLSGRAELSTARRHLQPAGFIAVIALREVLRADHDHVTVIGE